MVPGAAVKPCDFCRLLVHAATATHGFPFWEFPSSRAPRHIGTQPTVPTMSPANLIFWTITNMRKLEAVEEARLIMTQGLEWGVFKWLMEKPKVRKIADRATDALNDAEDKVKANWSDDLKRAYNHLATQATAKGKKASKDDGQLEPEVLETARKVFEADEETETMRLDAEDTFAEGERKLSAALAREGAQKALATYDLHEKAIRKAEAAARTK